MTNNSKLQKEFLDLITGKTELNDENSKFLKKGKISAEAAIDIYKNNFVGGCTKSLSLTYAAVEKLVGENFFQKMCEIYIGKNIPESTNLNDYGGNFAEFIDSFEPAKTLPYLGDIAELEYFISLSYKSDDSADYDSEKFGKLSDDKKEMVVLTLNQSLFLLESEFPIKEMYEYTVNDNGSKDELNLNGLEDKDQYLMIRKINKKPVIEKIDEQEFLFLKMIQEKCNLIEIFEELDEQFENNQFSEYLIKNIQNEIIAGFK